jgi:hypothetical protein
MCPKTYCQVIFGVGTSYYYEEKPGFYLTFQIRPSSLTLSIACIRLRTPNLPRMLDM